MIFILLYVGSCLQYNTVHNFSVWITIGSNPADSFDIAMSFVMIIKLGIINDRTTKLKQKNPGTKIGKNVLN